MNKIDDETLYVVVDEDGNLLYSSEELEDAQAYLEDSLNGQTKILRITPDGKEGKETLTIDGQKYALHLEATE